MLTMSAGRIYNQYILVFISWYILLSLREILNRGHIVVFKLFCQPINVALFLVAGRRLPKYIFLCIF